MPHTITRSIDVLRSRSSGPSNAWLHQESYNRDHRLAFTNDTRPGALQPSAAMLATRVEVNLEDCVGDGPEDETGDRYT